MSWILQKDFENVSYIFSTFCWCERRLDLCLDLILKYIFSTFNASLICEIYYCNTETTSQRTVNWRMFSHSPCQSVQLKTDHADSLVSPPSPPLRPPWRPPAGGGHLARCRWGLRGHDGGSRGHPGERGWYDGWNLVNKIFLRHQFI